MIKTQAPGDGGTVSPEIRTRFPTISEAIAYGYRRPIRSDGRGNNDGLKYFDRDTSGTDAFGYSFETPDGTEKTVTVTLTETKNKIGRMGAYMAMFPPIEGVSQ